ncbi:MAG: hypothetical protein RLZZ244_3132 [Verrucomicrobiota bacterium]
METPSPEPQNPTSPSPAPHRWGRRLLAGCALAVYSVLLAYGALHWGQWMENRKTVKLRGVAPVAESGAWGDLLTYDIRIEQPKEYAAFEDTAKERPLWHFGNIPAEEVRAILIQSGLSNAQADSALQPAFVSTHEQGTTVSPSAELVLSLSPQARSSLYQHLSGIPANRYHAAPFFVPKGDAHRLFIGDKGATPETIRLVEKLLYYRNGYAFFSDPELIFARIQTKEQRLDFFQSLTGQNAVLARLLIKPTADIDKLIGYWCPTVAGVRIRDLRPLLEAEQRLPDGGHVSLLYLLPPLARERLYTFPTPSTDPNERQPDCHWTALNFFNPKPDPRYGNPNEASRAVVENYYQIAKPGIPGDLVLLVNPRGHVIHSAVHIASDLTFTKNGINYAVPWILMRTDDLVGTYSHGEPVHAVYYRRKEL